MRTAVRVDWARRGRSALTPAPRQRAPYASSESLPTSNAPRRSSRSLQTCEAGFQQVTHDQQHHGSRQGRLTSAHLLLNRARARRSAWAFAHCQDRGVEWWQFGLDVLRVIIWPLVIVGLVTMMGRTHLRDFVSGITEGSMLGATFKRQQRFEQQAAEAKQQADEVLVGSATSREGAGEPQVLAVGLGEGVGHVVPSRLTYGGVRAIDDAWEALRDALIDASRRVGVSATAQAQLERDGEEGVVEVPINPAELVRKLKAYGMPALDSTVDQLRRVRNGLIHQRLAPTDDTVMDFVLTANRVRLEADAIARDEC